MPSVMAAVPNIGAASEILTKGTSCVEVWYTSNLRRLRLGEEIKKEER